MSNLPPQPMPPNSRFLFSEAGFAQRLELRGCAASPQQTLKAIETAAAVLSACGVSVFEVIAGRDARSARAAGAASRRGRLDEAGAALALAQAAAASTLSEGVITTSFELVLRDHPLH